MANPIHPTRVNHLNVVIEDFDRGLRHFEQLYGAEFLLDIRRPEFHAGLIEFGQVIFEFFVPHDFLLNSRHGPHYLGIEYQADMDRVREAIAACGIRIVRDIGMALHTHPADCFGIAFEFYAGEFHERNWDRLGRKMRSAQYWRDEHPLGLTGLKGYTHAVYDLAAARTFLQGFIGAEVVYETSRPALAAHALGLQVADSLIELLVPAGAGRLQEHLQQHGQGIRSAILSTRDIAQAARYFRERGVEPVAGYAVDAFAVPAAANLGLLFEFAE